MDTQADLSQPQQVFRDFRVSTMATAGTVLAASTTGSEFFKQPTSTYGLLENAVVGVANGRVIWVIAAETLPKFQNSFETIIGNGKLMTPGLIDCHTHLVYAGDRTQEWEQRLAGVSYEQIARNGGGILSTVRDTRLATQQQLFESAARRLKHLMNEGVTTVEIKSGYGLDLDGELKMLRAARQLESEFDISIESTLLAAHTVPSEYAGHSDRYIDLVCEEIIPAAKDLCSSVDAFCESIAFNVEQTKRVFDAAKRNGLNFKVHAEQRTRTGIAVIAAQMGALSIDHLEFLSDGDCRILGQHRTVATLLPGAYYCLREQQKPPVVALRENNVPIAVASDCNPGSSPITSILLVANMACNLFGLTAEESLAAITINAAKALGLEQQIGSIQPGHRADFAVWDTDSPAKILYGLGCNPCVAVYRAGKKRDTQQSPTP